jgi:ubiquinone/menaquinone biosynthesis C-methylase UbiE
MNYKDLDLWYNLKEYEIEKEINQIKKLVNLKNKNILIVGEYGTLAISHKIHKDFKKIYCVSEDKKLISYCKKNKNREINFIYQDNKIFPFENNYFDVILMLWAGIQYKEKKISIVKETKRVLKNTGILLIEEADETSEYIKILTLILPKKSFNLKKKRDKLDKLLQEYFRVKKNKLRTYYNFNNIENCIKYFEKEIIFHENKRLNNNNKLKNYLKSRKKLRIEEKSIFFICKNGH